METVYGPSTKSPLSARNCKQKTSTWRNSISKSKTWGKPQKTCIWRRSLASDLKALVNEDQKAKSEKQVAVLSEVNTAACRQQTKDGREKLQPRAHHVVDRASTPQIKTRSDSWQKRRWNSISATRAIRVRQRATGAQTMQKNKLARDDIILKALSPNEKSSPVFRKSIKSGDSPRKIR